MDSPVQTEDIVRERSRNPSPDISQPVSHFEDGLERIVDPDALDRYDGIVVQTRAPALTMRRLLVTCTGVEQEVEAYHRGGGACLSDRHRVDRAEEGGGLQHPVETQADVPVAAPLETLMQVGDDDPGLGVLEGHMAHVISAESAKEEHNQNAALSPGGKMKVMSELLCDKRSEDKHRTSGMNQHHEEEIGTGRPLPLHC